MTFSCVLLDIEGTTTSISFVKDQLFPYVVKNLKNYLELKWDSEELQYDLNELRQQVEEDRQHYTDVPEIASKDSEKSIIIDTVIANINWLMSHDRKVTGLKQLQGHMWREGYQSGSIKGHLYDDVLPSIKSWTANGKKVYIYSSGSTEAQQLLFGNSIFGNLLNNISGHFDTKIGMKIHSTSYAKIAKEIGIRPKEILFLTDIPAEADAAIEAGLQAKIVVRPGNTPLDNKSQERFSLVTSFTDVS